MNRSQAQAWARWYGEHMRLRRLQNLLTRALKVCASCSGFLSWFPVELRCWGS